MKKYIKDTISGIDEQIQEIQAKRKQNKILYSIGIGIAVALGISVILTQSWLAVALFGAAVSLYGSRSMTDHNLAATEGSLCSQKDHLNSIAKDGLDPQKVTSAENRDKMDKLDKNRKKQEEDCQSSIGKQQLLNAVIVGTIIGTGLLASPLMACASFGSMWLKHRIEKEVRTRHTDLENTMRELNNTTNDYNVGVRMIRRRSTQSTNANPTTTNTNTQARPVARRVPNRTATNTQTQASQPVVRNNQYSREDEEAVDAYIHSMEEQNDDSTANKIKRKV